MQAQQDEGIPTVLEPCPTASELEPESHVSPVPGPSGDLTPPPRTSLPVSFLPDIPLSGTPLVGCPFSDLLAIPSQGKWTTLLVVHLTIITPRRPMSAPQKLRLGVSTAPHGVMTIYPT